MPEKAAEELAKLGQKSLETAEKAGGWLDQTFGEGFRNLGGAFEDSMAGFRVRNRTRVLAKTQKAIQAAGLSGNTRPLDPRISIPLLGAISDESDENLQDVWATYIKNAVDPTKPNPDRIIIDVVRRLEPSDWSAIKCLAEGSGGVKTPADLGLSDDECENVMDRLAVIGLFHYDDPRSAVLVGGDDYAGALKVKIGDGSYYETKLFRRFVNSIGNVEAIDV
ncbi:hypothetical protein [Agrobacterium cavarae]|uniref:Abi-alpha family protein n=1 Tax=Agrobacterium cavarae TaxID=2528239 RepID=UPI002FFA66CD